MTDPASTALPDEAVPELAACAHHWVLSAPRHDSTRGVCRTCGVEREFMDTYRAPAARGTSRPARRAPSNPASAPTEA